MLFFLTVKKYFKNSYRSLTINWPVKKHDECRSHVMILNIPINIQSYLQRMRLQRRLYRVDTVCFLIFMVYSCKLDSFFAKSFNKQLIDCIQGRRLNLTWESSYLKNFESSLQFHSFWVTLCATQQLCSGHRPVSIN